MLLDNENICFKNVTQIHNRDLTCGMGDTLCGQRYETEPCLKVKKMNEREKHNLEKLDGYNSHLVVISHTHILHIKYICYNRQTLLSLSLSLFLSLPITMYSGDF